MKRQYTISGLKSLYDLPKMDMVQVTLNGRQFPSSRKTVAAVQSLREAGINTPIILHYDFIYIISRYIMFKQSVKEAIMEEIAGLLAYAKHDVNIVGLVMHTDWPLRKELQNAKETTKFITDNYNGSIWDTNFIVDFVSKRAIGTLIETSLLKFAEDLIGHYTEGKLPFKIYLENTTKIGPNGEGSLKWIIRFLQDYPWLLEVFGIVYDTEHHYAATGEWLSMDEIKSLSEITSLIIHVNTVPPEVKPKSYRDRHSETTISECSLNSKEYYDAYTASLSSLNIPWVREVHEDTMYRELEQCK